MPARILNKILSRLCEKDSAFIANHSELIPLRAGDTILRDGAEISYAIFPHSGQICLSRSGIEIMSFGAECAFIPPATTSGASLGGDIVVQLDGVASRVDICHIEALAANDREIGSVLADNYVSTMKQLCRHVACTVTCSARMRICRWLIVAHQRCNFGAIDVRQAGIAAFLGVRRATVSEVCGDLQRRGIIEYRRGRIEIIDEAALVTQACATCPDLAGYPEQRQRARP